MVSARSISPYLILTKCHKLLWNWTLNPPLSPTPGARVYRCLPLVNTIIPTRAQHIISGRRHKYTNHCNNTTDWVLSLISRCPYHRQDLFNRKIYVDACYAQPGSAWIQLLSTPEVLLSTSSEPFSEADASWSERSSAPLAASEDLTMQWLVTQATKNSELRRGGEG